MKLWFGTTTLKYSQYKDLYLQIRNYLIDSGHILTDDWLGNHGKWIEENPTATRNIKNVYRKVVNAINDADASIIEFTVPNFSSSHQITYSIQRQKLVLVLRLKDEKVQSDPYIDALDSPYLKIVDYERSHLYEVLDEFLGLASLENGQGRYNIVLDKKHNYYLDWASNKYKMSRSAIIRELIKNKMDADDDFSIYLKG